MIHISANKITKLLKKNFFTIEELRASFVSKERPYLMSDIQRLKNFQDVVFQEITFIVQTLLKQLELGDCMSLWNNTNSLILEILTEYYENTVRDLIVPSGGKNYTSSNPAKPRSKNKNILEPADLFKRNRLSESGAIDSNMRRRSSFFLKRDSLTEIPSPIAFRVYRSQKIDPISSQLRVPEINLFANEKSEPKPATTYFENKKIESIQQINRNIEECTTLQFLYELDIYL